DDPVNGVDPDGLQTYESYIAGQYRAMGLPPPPPADSGENNEVERSATGSWLERVAAEQEPVLPLHDLGDAAGHVHHAICARSRGSRIFSIQINPTIGKLRRLFRRRGSLGDQPHHIIQDAAVRNLPGYNPNKAPGIRLRGPSTDRTTPHGIT